MSKTAPTNHFKGQISQESYIAVKQLAEGGQGKILLAKDAHAQEVVIKWYHPIASTDQQRAIISSLISKGCPRACPQGVNFVWPREIVIRPNYPKGFGYVMDKIDTARLATVLKIREGNTKQPRLKTLCRISARLVQGLECLHGAGWVYGDINHGNVLFDTEHAKVVILDNDNVTVNNSEIGVLGTPNFMAPEVALGKAKPSAESDLYSTALLIYYLWLWAHPMEGKRTLDVYSMDGPAIRKFFHESPTFHFHPTDATNTALSVEGLETQVLRWQKMCPKPLKEAFIRSFTQGVHDSTNRLRLSEWYNLFREMELLVYSCRKCTADNYVDPDACGFDCFHCAHHQPVAQWLQWKNVVTGNHRVPIMAGMKLSLGAFKCSFENEGEELTALEIEAHPKASGALVARNALSRAIVAQTPDGKSLQLEKGKGIALIPNTVLEIDGIKVAFIYHR